MNHKVFISHASEDKERFVITFATALREVGLDAWVDLWEIAPGDSVVRRIFDEGLGQADTVIVVLSKYSVNKPWVRAELDVAKVREIEEHTRLIPIVLEDCEVPMALRATRWVRIKNLKNYDTELKSIIMAINGMHDRPALGSAPAYTTTPITSIGGLPKVASLALKLCYDKMVECYPHLPESKDIIAQMEAMNIPHQEAVNALDILDRRNYIGGAWTLGVEIFHTFWYEEYGLQTYIDAYISDYPQIERDVAVQIVNHNETVSDEIANKLGKPHLLTIYSIMRLCESNFLKYSAMNGAMIHVWDVSPELAYALQDGSLAA